MITTLYRPDAANGDSVVPVVQPVAVRVIADHGTWIHVQVLSNTEWREGRVAYHDVRLDRETGKAHHYTTTWCRRAQAGHRECRHTRAAVALCAVPAVETVPDWVRDWDKTWAPLRQERKEEI